jgi:type I restriction enzyme M protein
MTLTQSELETKLKYAADLLRGPVDPTDFKNYIFPLLFFKRISDTYDAEHAQALRDYDGAENLASLPENYRFNVPSGCHWSDLRRVTDNIGAALQNILDRLQESNPKTLAGIFGAAVWADKERLPETALTALLDHFQSLYLGPDEVPNDMLGAGYEYLLKCFADESGQKAGEFFTPRPVVRLLAHILDPQPGESIYDPACGSGGMLVESVNGVRAEGGDTRTLRLFGQEVSLTTSAIARMNLYLHDIEDFKVVRGDVLRDPKFLTDEAHLRRFDVVIANPPFSLRNWGANTWAADPYHRSFCGVPPKNNADFAWVQHMVASMKPETGRVGVVMPHGVLFRGGGEKVIRECLVKNDQLEAVIGLAPNLFYSTSIPACLLIFRAVKIADRRGHVLFVDGSARFTKGRNQNQLGDDDVAAMVAAYRTGRVPDGVGGAEVRLVSHAEIKENGWDLNIGRYLKGAAAEIVDVKTAFATYEEAKAALHNAENELAIRLKAAGYE